MCDFRKIPQTVFPKTSKFRKTNFEVNHDFRKRRPETRRFWKYAISSENDFRKRHFTFYRKQALNGYRVQIIYIHQVAFGPFQRTVSSWCTWQAWCICALPITEITKCTQHNTTGKGARSAPVGRSRRLRLCCCVCICCWKWFLHSAEHIHTKLAIYTKNQQVPWKGPKATWCI